MILSMIKNVTVKPLFYFVVTTGSGSSLYSTDTHFTLMYENS